MKQLFLTYKNYRIISTLCEDETKSVFDAITKKRYATEEEYKNDESRFVQKILIPNRPSMIYKIPHSRNKRTWERFLTLFRDSESFRNFKSMHMLERLGLKSTKPVFAAEKRVFGVAIESFLIYYFVEGRMADTEDTPKVIEAMTRLHEKGFIRSDPKLRNFIIHDKDVVFIDFRLKKPPIFNALLCKLNFLKFVQSLPDKEKLIDNEAKKSLLFKIAYFLERFFNLARKARRKIKKI